MMQMLAMFAKALGHSCSMLFAKNQTQMLIKVEMVQPIDVIVFQQSIILFVNVPWCTQAREIAIKTIKRNFLISSTGVQSSILDSVMH